MDEGLHRLAEIYGIAASYQSESGEHRVIAADVKRALLAAMGVVIQDEGSIHAALTQAPRFVIHSHGEGPPQQPCYVPDWLKSERTWGISCQLYGLRSARNHGIGDFEDLARLCEIGAGVGADFIGTNPLHALFSAEPERASPYSPSTRRFLNPLYIALDQPPLASIAHPVAPDCTGSLIDYRKVAQYKHAALEQAFDKFHNDASFLRFREDGGEALEAFAIFEALSHAMHALGHGSGWHGWPDEYRDSRSPAVARFVADHQRRIDFFVWQQWVATQQLGDVQRRARAAGMRIGLYLDLAVGVAPDGMETWWDPDIVVANARIGAPPDLFNPNGQDWGLAPLSPTALIERDLQPFTRDIEALMRHAGAIRIDHAMGMQRLFWIPGSATPSGGGYIQYPLDHMLRGLSEASHRYSTVVIGEDLGTVPENFRERMKQAEVQSYRLMLFERGHESCFLPPEAYPREALACFTTHDLPTLAGWWEGQDISLRNDLGLVSNDDAQQAKRERAQDRARLLDALIAADLISSHDREDLWRLPHLPTAVAAAAHIYVARTPARLMAAQIDDLVGELQQVNLPGTYMEYPNWRRVLGTPLEDLGEHPEFQSVTSAIARERRRLP